MPELPEQNSIAIQKIISWTEEHEMSDRTRFDTIDASLRAIPTHEEMQDLMRATMSDTFLRTGKTAKVVILTIAAIVGALVIIGGGFKMLLSWIGISILRG